MPTGAITEYIDVAQIMLYLFWVFFAGLIYYLHQENKREGYPLESDRSGQVKVQGFPPIPSPKTYLLANGETVTVPRASDLQPPLPPAAIASHLGAPLEPTGEPMGSGVGPGAYALRADVPDRTLEGEARIVPLRVAAGFDVASGDTDPRGLPVVGADNVAGGTVRDLWVDRSEGRDSHRAAADQLRAHRLAPRARGFGARRPAGRRAADTAAGTGDAAGRREDHGVLRGRHLVCRTVACGAAAVSGAEMSHRHTTHEHEHEFEASHGLPEALPRGERVLWQGSPDWRALAVQAFHVRKAAIYFAVMLGLHLTSQLAAETPILPALAATARLLALALVALALLASLAWLSARSTVYTVTDQRVVMRIGIVLTLTFNLPYQRIEGAALHRSAKGHGDIALTLAKGERIAYLHLWPHVRPWRVKQTEPQLRSVANAVSVAATLAQAWSLARAETQVAPVPLKAVLSAGASTAVRPSGTPHLQQA